MATGGHMTYLELMNRKGIKKLVSDVVGVS